MTHKQINFMLLGLLLLQLMDDGFTSPLDLISLALLAWCVYLNNRRR